MQPKTNHVVRLMLDNFVKKLIKGIYVDQSNGKHSVHNHEQGDFVRLILTHDSMMSKSQGNTGRMIDGVPPEQGDLNPRIIELNGLNLPTHFGEYEDFTNFSYDDNDFKFSNLFDEHVEVLADTFWSSEHPRDLLVRDEHDCLMSVFDVYTVTTSIFLYRLFTEMSSPPPQHCSARPKTTVPGLQVKYACVACNFYDFKTAHSLRRHLIQVHNLSCDTIVQGRPFPHTGHVMRRPNDREIHQFPRTIFPGD